MQSKDSAAFRGWLKVLRERASQKSVGLHAWFKTKQKEDRQEWESKNPVTRNSRTVPDVKQTPGWDCGEMVGATIGKAIGIGTTPLQRAQNAANSAKLYECPQCGESMKLAHRKRDMVIHCRKPDNKACLDMVSESGDLQQMEWIRRLASEDHCPCCEQDLGIIGNMSRHLEKPDNCYVPAVHWKIWRPRIDEHI